MSKEEEEIENSFLANSIGIPGALPLFLQVLLDYLS